MRPAFLFTSKWGRGAGKSKTAEAIADVWGGSISVSFARRSLDEFKSRLLDDTGLRRRVVLVDNIKGVASSAEIEAMVTAKVLDGKRMYFGDYRRINNLTWFLTANSPSLSKDLTDRSVIIRIGRPRVENFDRWCAEWIQHNRLKLIADLLAILSGPDQCTISQENLDRWNTWQREILQKVPCGNELAHFIKELRPTVDADTDEADQVAEEIERFLASCKLDRSNIEPRRTIIGIPNNTLFALMRSLWNDGKLSAKAIRQRLNNLIGCGKLSQLQPNSCRTYGRNMIWKGDDADPAATVAYPWSSDWLNKYKFSFTPASEEN